MASSEEEINLRINGLRDAQRELNDVATGAQRTARITDQLARSFDHLENEAEDAQRALDRVNDEIANNGPTAELNAELAQLQHRLSEISDERRVGENLRAQFRRSTAAAAQLDHQLAATRRELDRLNDEYSRGGDPAVLRQIEEQQRALERLNGIRRRIAAEDENDQRRLARMAEEARRTQARREDEDRRRTEDEENRSWLRRLRRRVSNAGDGLQGAPVPPQAMAIGAAIGASAAVPLLAAIGGALTGAVGAGIAGAGIAGAIMGDPEKFKTEWASATDTVKSEFLDATEVFAGPTLDAIRSIGPLVESWDLGEMFGDAAKFVQPLVRGVEGFATGIVRGVAAMVNKGGPAVEALSSGFAELGDAAGDAFTSIADGAEGGGEALRDTLFAVAGVIRLFGDLTEAAEDTYGFIHDHPILSAIGSGGLSLTVTLLDQVSDKSNEAHGALREIGPAGASAGEAIAAAWEGAEKAMSDAADAADHLYDTQMGLVDSSISYEQALDDMRDSFKENGNNWDIMTQKGRDNTKAVMDSVDAAKQVRDSNIASGESAAEANRKYEDTVAWLKKAAMEAGMTAEQFDAMTKALLNYINTPQNKTITTKFVDIHYVSQEGRIGDGTDPRRNTGSAYASGGSVAETGMSLFGEKGPELRFASKGDYIATAKQTAALRSGGGGANAGPPVIRVIIEDTSGRVLRDTLVTTAANQGQTVGQFLGL